MSAIQELCPNCGLCCDSSLFADVELRQGDDPQRLANLGLAIRKKSKTKLAFAQPCACFDGKLCKIYAGRPKRCRLFECGLLKRVCSGDMTTGAALDRISEAKSRVERVRELLRQVGQRDERMALTYRYAEVMSAPIELGDKHDAGRRGELMMAMDDLMQMLEGEFLR